MTDSESNAHCIWLVRGHGHTSNLRGWRPFEAPMDTESVPEEILEAMQLAKRGYFLPQDRFPTDNYPRRDDRPGAAHERIPAIFSNGFAFVTKASADVLRQFDMGDGALYPTRLWHRDKTTPVPGEFFYLNQGNVKDAFLLERSPLARRTSIGTYTTPPNPTDDQLCFSTAALSGPDIWWDRQISFDFFISDRLARALREAKLSHDWMLLRCPIID